MAFAPQAPKNLFDWLTRKIGVGNGSAPQSADHHSLRIGVGHAFAYAFPATVTAAGPGIASGVNSSPSRLVWRRGERAATGPVFAIADGSDATQAGESITDFDALYDRYGKQLFNAIYQWVGDYEEAADLTQETFVSAYRARDQFRGDARIYTWLYRIAYNHCKNRFKQRDRQRQMEGLSLDAGVGDGDGEDLISETREIADWSYSPARILEQKELRAVVDRAVDSLASEYKVVLLLREVDGLSYNEISEVTGLTMEAVKTRLNRARGMVRQRVEPYYKT